MSVINGAKNQIGDVHYLSKIIDIYRDENNRLHYRTQCILCGKEKNIRASDFNNNKFTSCRCQLKTHGMSDTKLYNVYANIKDRCYREGHREYKNYGGKGVVVCEEWLNSYEEFYRWAMENGYEEGLTIDRIDENGNYEPSNCQWITRSENTIKANKTCQHRRANKGIYCGTDPYGNYYEFENANVFAKEHDLDAKCVRSVANGNSKLHRGWKFGFVCESKQ